MDMSSIMTENLSSIQGAISTAMLRKSMSKDSQTVDALLQGMEQANAKVLEASVTPHKGGSIDLSA